MATPYATTPSRCIGQFQSMASNGGVKNPRQIAAEHKNMFPCTRCQKNRKNCDRKSWNDQLPCSMCKGSKWACELSDKKKKKIRREFAVFDQFAFIEEHPGERRPPNRTGQKIEENRCIELEAPLTFQPSLYSLPSTSPTLNTSPTTSVNEVTNVFHDMDIHSSPVQLKFDIPSRPHSMYNTAYQSGYRPSDSSSIMSSPSSDVSYSIGDMYLARSQTDYIQPAVVYNPWADFERRATYNFHPSSSSLRNWDGGQSSNIGASRSASQPMSPPQHQSYNYPYQNNQFAEPFRYLPQVSRLQVEQEELKELSACPFEERNLA